jgi:hypothetical protein
LPAAVAGQIYRDLHQRFGTPTNLQIATTPDDEEKEAADEEGNALIADQSGVEPAENTNATATPPAAHKLVPESSQSNVKRVINPVNIPAQKSETQKAATPAKANVKPVIQPDERPRRTREIQP